jgi:general secretion pathway protein H
MLNTTLISRRARGFTLLEIMIVIVIVGIIAMVSVIAFGTLGRDREMQDAAERIGAIINQTREESELQGFDVGMRVGINRYDFLRFDARQQLWLPIVDDTLMSARELEPGLRIRLWLEGREVVLKENLTPSGDEITAAAEDEDDREGEGLDNSTEDQKENEKEMPPQIMILSNGDLNSFDLHLEREDSNARWRVFLSPDNTVVTEEVSESI